ncbi:hypothetical protein NDU88_007293 [Pleurodeles waltl]|uniref:Uncharacterized protein n=1 Tax=Pleurodeles waltl TaxID=8319 RepID=A0AAV7RPQ3_PLEWA|nr:hypothetical protein NDU88_007293 [Pleurodeles waltl]
MAQPLVRDPLRHPPSEVAPPLTGELLVGLQAPGLKQLRRLSAPGPRTLGPAAPPLGCPPGYLSGTAEGAAPPGAAPVVSAGPCRSGPACCLVARRPRPRGGPSLGAARSSGQRRPSMSTGTPELRISSSQCQMAPRHPSSLGGDHSRIMCGSGFGRMTEGSGALLE